MPLGRAAVHRILRMELSALLPILSVIIAGGGVGIYLARSHKESLNISATKDAVETISTSMTNLRTDNANLRTEVNDARAETNDARAEVLKLRLEFEAHIGQLRSHIDAQNKAILALGGRVDDLHA